MTKEEIDKICRVNKITNYNINSDGSIDVDGEVALMHNNLRIIPLQFNKVTGDFLCYRNELSSLKGCPIEVGGNFMCSNNKITSLKFCPKKVSRNFLCGGNELVSLEGVPEEIVESFSCSHNVDLTSLKFLPKKIDILFASTLGIKNPYEYRYIFFSQIREINIDDEEVKLIIEKYYGKPEYYHLAMEELLDLAEQRGISNE